MLVMWMNKNMSCIRLSLNCLVFVHMGVHVSVALYLHVDKMNDDLYIYCVNQVFNGLILINQFVNDKINTKTL